MSRRTLAGWLLLLSATRGRSAITAAAESSNVDREQRRRRPLLIAHNADSIDKLTEATTAGADIVEADIWNTEDGLLVAHQLAPGDWTPPAAITERFFDSVPLETWLASLTKRTIAMFDIKDLQPSTTELVAGALENSSETLTAFLCSPYWHHVEETDRFPNLTGVYTVNSAEALSNVFPLLREPGSRGLSIAREFVTPEVVSTAHELGAFVFVWTVNSVSDAQYLAGLGVDGITTDSIADLLSGLTD